MSFKRKVSLGFLFLIFLFIGFYRWLLKKCRNIEEYGWRIVCVIISLVFLTFGIIEGWTWHHFATTPLLKQSSTTIIITPNMTLKRLAATLHERGLLSHTKFFIFFVHQKGQSNKLRMGEYAIDSRTTPETLLDNIVHSKVVMRKLTLYEGITMRQIRELLLHDDALQHVAVKQTDQEMMTALGHPGESSEGHFFPDTYLYTWGNKDTVILQQAYQRMDNLLTQEWPQREPNLPYQTPEQALIVASLIESEAVITAERPVIAGVIVRRLQNNMNLQIDPTVIYGAGKPFGSIITIEDLRNDSPYNTYLHKGLPPTAINMPSAASIYAALHPAPGDSLYYVAQGDGSHHFSATYPEHLQAVQKYRQYKKSEANKQKWFGLGIFIIRSSGSI